MAYRDRSLFEKVDYSLLLTFLFFFVFIGNMNRFPPFREFVVNMIAGHEKVAAIGISQVISNVPAALLLSNFTDQWEQLIIGTNLGGAGTHRVHGQPDFLQADWRPNIRRRRGAIWRFYLVESAVSGGFDLVEGKTRGRKKLHKAN